MTEHTYPVGVDAALDPAPLRGRWLVCGAHRDRLPEGPRRRGRPGPCWSVRSLVLGNPPRTAASGAVRQRIR